MAAPRPYDELARKLIAEAIGIGVDEYRLHRVSTFLETEFGKRASGSVAELDQLAYEAYIADCQAQGDPMRSTWEALQPEFKKRYRAIAHQIRNHYTNSFLSAVQLESSLIASLAIVGAEIKRHEGNEVIATYYRWRVNTLDLDGYAESFNQALAGLISELIPGYEAIGQDEYHYPEQRFTGQLLHESGEDPGLFLGSDPELP